MIVPKHKIKYVEINSSMVKGVSNFNPGKPLSMSWDGKYWKVDKPEPHPLVHMLKAIFY